MSECSCGNCGRAENQTPFFFQNFQTKSVSFSYTGAQINALFPPGAVFPKAVKVAEIDLQSNAGIIALTLSSSISNFFAGSTAAVYLALDNGDVADVNGMTRQFVQHVCGQNSVAGLPSASARTNAVQMGQNSYYTVNSGQKIAVYASAPNDASTLLSGVATVFWIAR